MNVPSMRVDGVELSTTSDDDQADVWLSVRTVNVRARPTVCREPCSGVAWACTPMR